ncbi:MAG: type II toxin-antitoxin system YoeB family toxin [Eggerthellaceae bacterium]|nr:type II toxin-antitoxin system YoeB family toxin [Eggerthellaceae bacterium]
MAITFSYTANALRDLKDWNKQHNVEALNTIKDIQTEIAKDPASLEGRYSPEKLKRDFAGWYSRRITMTDRFVYRPSASDPEVVEVAQCKGHYEGISASGSVSVVPAWRGGGAVRSVTVGTV